MNVMRKGTEGINQYYIEANKIADYTVFVSEWLKNTYKDAGYLSKIKMSLCLVLQ